MRGCIVVHRGGIGHTKMSAGRPAPPQAGSMSLRAAGTHMMAGPFQHSGILPCRLQQPACMRCIACVDTPPVAQSQPMEWDAASTFSMCRVCVCARAAGGCWQPCAACHHLVPCCCHQPRRGANTKQQQAHAFKYLNATGWAALECSSRPPVRASPAPAHRACTACAPCPHYSADQGMSRQNSASSCCQTRARARRPQQHAGVDHLDAQHCACPLSWDAAAVEKHAGKERHTNTCGGAEVLHACHVHGWPRRGQQPSPIPRERGWKVRQGMKSSMIRPGHY